MQKITIAAGALAATALALTACGSTGPQAIRGALIITENCPMAAVDYGITTGTQVVIRDSAGSVAGVTALGKMKTAGLGVGNAGTCRSFFKAAITPGQPRYSIDIGTGHGSVWFTAAQMKAGPVLTLAAPVPGY